MAHQSPCRLAVIYPARGTAAAVVMPGTDKRCGSTSTRLRTILQSSLRIQRGSYNMARNSDLPDERHI
jgi:hypothetical protein